MKKIIAAAAMNVAVLLSPSQSAIAAGWFSGSIDRVELTHQGEILLFLESPTNHECGSKRVDYVNPTDATSRAFLGALLAWQAQDKAVQVYIASCNGNIGIFNTLIDQ